MYNVEKDEERQLSSGLDAPATEIAKEAPETGSRDVETVTSVLKSLSSEYTVKSAVASPSRKSIKESWATATTEESHWQENDLADAEVTKTSSIDRKSNQSTNKLGNDGGSRISSTGDICRICHMGSFPALSGSLPMWEWPNRGARRIDSQISTLSSYAYLGPLISACKCRGTVGLVHTECLERWLTESGHTRCELCGHRYVTKRVPRHGIVRSAVIWFNTVIATRQMLLDILYLVVTTPLALFSCYVCALALKLIIEGGFQDIPWMIVAMLPTCSLTLVAYWGWLITLGRLHGRRWRRFWRNNFVVRLIPDAGTFPVEAQRTSNDEVQERMEYQSTRRLEYDENNDFLLDQMFDDEDETFLALI